LLKLKCSVLFTIMQVLVKTLVVIVVLPDPFQGMRVQRNERGGAKDGAPRGLDAGHPVRGELDPADDVCWRCKKNSSSVLSCIDKRSREGCE